MLDIYDRILDEVDDALPQFNVNTLKHVRQDPIKSLPKELDTVFSEVIKTFPNSNIEYIGHKVLSPEEVTEYSTQNQKYTSQVDVTRSELVLVEFRFSYNQEEFSIKLYVPFMTEDAMIINGSRYYLMFALTDKVFYHIEKEHGIGIKVLKAQLRFVRNFRYRFLSMKNRVYGEQLVFAKTHLRKYKYSSEDIRTTLTLYFLVKYGLKGTLAKYGIDEGSVLIVNDYDLEDQSFDYFEIRPKTDTQPGLYLKVAQDLLDLQYDVDVKQRIKIRKIAELHYILQYFVKCKITMYKDNVMLRHLLMDDPLNYIYRVILGKTSYGINYENEIQVANFADSHLASLDTYIDPNSKAKLDKIGVHCNDVYDLFYYVDTHIDEFVSNYFPSNIYDKQLNVIDLLLGNTIRSLFRKIYSKTNLKKKHKEFTLKEIEASLRIGPKILTKLYSCSDLVVVNPSQYNDNWLLTVGGRKKRATYATVADDGGKAFKGKKSDNDINLIHDPAHRLHSSMVYVESLSKIQSTDPTIGGTLNPYCPFDDFGQIIKGPWIEEILPLDKYIHTR